MVSMLETISNLMNAITFAEAGEFETARQMMIVSPKGKTELNWFEVAVPGKSLS